MSEVLVETFACIMEKILEDSGDLTESEERAGLLLLLVLLTGEPCRGPLAFLMFLQEKLIEETLLRNGTVESLQTTICQEFRYVGPIVNKQFDKFWFVIDESIHHDFLQVTGLDRQRGEKKLWGVIINR